MRRALFRTVLLAAVAAFSALAPAAGILIVQLTETRSTEADSEHVLTQFLADEFDRDGRVIPIAWSLTDTVFRSAVDAKLIPNRDNPDRATILAAAEKLRTEYVLIVSASKKDSDILGRAQLLRKGQEVWKDPEGPEEGRIVTVMTNGTIDVSNSMRGAARTWTQLVFGGPMKALDPKPRFETPPVEQGLKSDIPDAPPAPPKVDNRELMATVMKLLAANKTADAIFVLRDAVDAEPLDAERRRALANALATSGLNATAAGEARRAADLFPEQVDFRTQAARFWMAADNVDEANADLNEAVARDPQSVETRILLGEVALSKLQVESALTHFDFAISKSPTGDIFFKRALARALNDDADGCSKDMAEAAKLGLGRDTLEIRSQYLTAVRVSKPALSEIGVAVRTLIQKAKVNFGKREVRDDQKELRKRAAALLSVFSAVKVPEAHKNSNGQRVLALKLLDQSLSELGSYLDSGSEDTVGDATITLGEALKALTAAEDVFKAESIKG